MLQMHMGECKRCWYAVVAMIKFMHNGHNLDGGALRVGGRFNKKLLWQKCAQHHDCAS